MSSRGFLLQTLKLFLLLYIPSLLLIGFGFLLQYNTRISSERSIIENDTRNNNQLIKMMIEGQFDTVLDDLYYVCQVEQLLNLESMSYDRETISRLGRIYRSFFQRKEIYDSLIWLDTSGKELLKVNYREGSAFIVPRNELLNTDKKHFIDETLKLSENEVYISPLELNTERGVIEYPEKPVLRVSSPIIGETGERKGVLVLNFKGDIILSTLEHAAGAVQENIMLVNPLGYWIFGAPRDKVNWGFMRGFPGDSLAAVYPELWEKVLASPEAGSAYCGTGSLYTYEKIYPFKTDVFPAEGYYWYLFSEFPGENLENIEKKIVLSLLSAGVPLLILFGILTWLLALGQSRRVFIEKDIREGAAIFDNNPDPVIKADKDGIILQCNTAAKNLFPEDLSGKSFYTIFPGIRNTIVDELAVPGIVRFRQTLVDRDFTFILKQEKEGGSFLIYGNDITHRREMEEELRRLKVAVEQSANAIIITDTNGNIVFSNHAFEQVTGYSKEEIIGSNPGILKSNYHGTQFYKDLWQAISSGQIWHGQFLNKKKDGATFWEEAVITPIKDNNDVICNYLAVKEDITRRKKAEEELLLAKEEAEEANRMKSEFLANMSHEIRTPMNAILGFTDILLDDMKNPEIVEKLEVIKQSGKSLLNLLNDILDFSKIEAGKIELVRSAFPIHKTIQHLYNMFQNQTDSREISFSVEIDQRLPQFVYGDEHRLKQILINLLSNAFKFTAFGEIILHCDYSEGEVRISVRDTGIGIPKDKVEKIFSAFEQADSSMERKYGGTGLGLAISIRLAKLMNGSLSVESEVGKGSVFTLSLAMPSQNSEENEEKKENTSSKDLSAKWIKESDSSIKSIVIDGIKEMPQRLASLKKAFRDNDVKKIKFITHEMVGFSGNLGMVEIYEIFSAMDEEINKENPGEERLEALLSSAEEIVRNISKERTGNKEKGGVFSSDSFYGIKILVAEDNTLNQKLISAFLSNLTISCDVANNGSEALDMLRKKEYDLLLLDMEMPVLNGVETIKKIRDDDELRNIYVIAMTANAMKGDEERYINYGCDDYIAKPIDRKLFESKIKERLSLLDKDSPGKRSKQEAGKNGDEEIRTIIEELRENLSIFNPNKIIASAEKITQRVTSKKFHWYAQRLRQAAENFDDEAVEGIIKEMEKL